MKICSVEECGRKVLARGWCGKHYGRWRKHGDPLGAAYRGPEATFLAMTEPIVGDPGCIIWTGSVASGGYGQIWDGERLRMVHRFAYERERGPIPDGMVIDHACWERTCVNIEHLRLATPAQNAASRSCYGIRRKYDLPRGVHAFGGKFQAVVTHEGRRHYLGLFDAPDQASAAAGAKRDELFGSYAGRSW